MTVRFKGTRRSENKHRARRARSASPPRKMTSAGLRSDQLGISREPQFQSKRRSPFKQPQVSSWENTALQRQQDTTKASIPPAAVPGAPTNCSENVETPLGPRAPTLPKALRTSQPQQESPSAHIPSASGEQRVQEPLTNGVNHVLRKKAGLKSERQKNGYQTSEYQRQFHWKAPVAESPLLAAEQMVYNSNWSIPPFKANTAVMESEYKRSFKGSLPPKAPRLRQEVERNELPPCQISLEKSKRKKNQQLPSRKSSLKDENLYPEPQPLQQELGPSQIKKATSPKVVRKMKTEYSTNFGSPVCYSYRDGVWVRSRAVGEELQELRKNAEAYRNRAWGTHFSRQHLSQILSDQNCLWEASSSSSPSSLLDEDACSTSSPMIEALDLARLDSVGGSCSPVASVPLSTSRRSSVEEMGLPKTSTLPVQRKLAWNEEETEMEQQQEREDEGDKNGHSEDKNEEVNNLDSDILSPAVTSVSTSEEGRLPTPKLKTMLAAQRTHHDRTTPATGGALLVSPLKNKDSKVSRRNELPLGKARSPYRHLVQDSPPHNKAGSSPVAAGMPTIDPLPLREDILSVDSPEPSSNPKPARTPHKQATSAWLMDTNPRTRIQGMLRDPEFQHNGNLGAIRPDHFVLPFNECSVSDDDDKMSQISCWSAASCSMATQVLDRAQKRKKDFWGKG